MTGPILIVEDDAALLSALGRILRAEGHVVIEAASGLEAVSTARRERPSLLVLDCTMPGMDGEMVLEALRPELKHTRTVLLTTTPSQEARAHRLGAESLGKPFRVEDLLRAVQGRRTPSDQTVRRTVRPNRPTKPSDEPSDQTVRPNRPTKPSDQTVRPNRPTKPSDQTVRPNRPTKPSDQTSCPVSGSPRP